MASHNANSNETESTHNFADGLLDADSTALNSAELAAVSALPAGHALLIVKRGYEEGSRFLLDTELTSVGRHPKADIFLDDVTVSRHHAEFVRTGKHFLVRDLASLNGTYYQGRRVEEILLEDGAEIQVGKFKLTFCAAKADL
jgi:pSer/pThr/pTyr-binding forkhead associated (FHA) protein